MAHFKVSFTIRRPFPVVENLIHPLKQRVHCNRELYLSSIAAIVLNNARPSGLFFQLGWSRIAWDKCCYRHGLDAQPHDIVNYLACSCAGELFRHSEAEAPVPNSVDTDCDTVPAYSPITCYTVALLAERAFLRPGDYSEACRTRQLVPPRYQHYFPGGSSCLSDLDALCLLAECSIQLKILDVFCPAFDSIRIPQCSWAALTDSTGLNCSSALNRLLSSVESLTLHGHCHNDQAPLAIGILSAALMSKRPALSLLDIGVVDSTMMQSLATFLSAQPISVWGVPFNVCCLQVSFCALTELKIEIEPSRSREDDYAYSNSHLIAMNALTSVIEQQRNLQVLTLTANYSLPHEGQYRLYTVLQVLCQQPTLRNLTLRHMPLPFAVAKGLVWSFLSSHCLSKQTLAMELPCWRNV